MHQVTSPDSLPGKPVDHRFCVAPMLDWTDRHARYLMRLASTHATLYTEMITTGALIHGDREHLLGYHFSEHPLALQLGGSDPKELAYCVELAAEYGYDEVNLNVGCPSNRVQSGRFGACLMAQPDQVASCVEAMLDAANLPVTVKCRIGIDNFDSYSHLYRFIEKQAKAGCETIIIHARKAILEGLTPKENREIPPLNYERVYAVKENFPELCVVINGGIKTLQDCHQHLKYTDGVMVGREAYQNPFLLAEVDQSFYGEKRPAKTRNEIFSAYLSYAERQLAEGQHLNRLTRHVLGLFQGQRGAKAFRRHISENAHKPGAGIEVLHSAFEFVK